ncbi:t(6)A37 threonylcarbamoyladenosine biosynthesis protein RimN [Dermatophilus congolensis]|uniref:L-threonylcarbamoyladenylate synthase n=1 Tax=Dermatophilus congolensis TaxID=1863 RepID=A0AA46GZM8_9MICO|nr:L-threonylcarbamoyladenylate synthase [Dermatophilus congolensis]STD04786.1 t(6)A37 threonylcarbamoyladenosine biosynthesis protein RimN [Dermatophilus congolensis]
MSEIVDGTDSETADSAIHAVADAVQRGEVVVIPTDTVYGVGVDAFNSEAIGDLLVAKGRGRSIPPPVLVPNKRTLDGLATSVPDYARRLVNEFWPGPLTIVLQAQSSLVWDLGDTNGTVALRMPDSELALAVLALTGPMAVTSANKHGHPAATSAADAERGLGDAVSIYLDGGPASRGQASTIIDATGADFTVLREGEISEAQLRSVAFPGDDVAPADTPEVEQRPEVEQKQSHPGEKATSASAESSAEEQGTSHVEQNKEHARTNTEPPTAGSSCS